MSDPPSPSAPGAPDPQAYRHSRQIRLAEVGDAGQARIAAMEAEVSGEGTVAILEARYLAGAGVKRIATVSDAIGASARGVDARVAVLLTFPREVEGREPDFGVRDPEARAVAVGAWRALDAIRRALQAGDTPQAEAGEAPQAEAEGPQPDEEEGPPTTPETAPPTSPEGEPA